MSQLTQFAHRSTFRAGHKAAVLLALLWLCSSSSPVAAQDGRTILQKMIDAYRGLSSYQGQSNGTMRQALAAGGTISEEGFTTTLTYQKPNKLKLDFIMPVGGRTVYCDGKTITYYQNRAQTFAAAPAVAANMKEVSACLLKLQIVGRYDTLFFLSGNGIPTRLTAFERRPDAFRNDRPVYVVTAHEKTTGNDIAWTWMIDKQTMMLARVEGRTWNAPGTVSLIVNNSRAVNKVRFEGILGQNILPPKLNTSLNPAEFVFRVPQNARNVTFNSVVEHQKHEFGGSSMAPAASGK